jgi:hypothetical protein
MEEQWREPHIQHRDRVDLLPCLRDAGGEQIDVAIPVDDVVGTP